MDSIIPTYRPPDFSIVPLRDAPTVRTKPVLRDGVVPQNFHGTSNPPEYVHLGGGNWLLAPESRMGAVLGEEGIYVHTTGFDPPSEIVAEKFSFRKWPMLISLSAG